MASETSDRLSGLIFNFKYKGPENYPFSGPFCFETGLLIASAEHPAAPRDNIAIDYLAHLDQ